MGELREKLGELRDWISESHAALFILIVAIVFVIILGPVFYLCATGNTRDVAYGVCENDCEAFGYEYHYCSPGDWGEDHCWCETDDGEIVKLY